MSEVSFQWTAKLLKLVKEAFKTTPTTFDNYHTFPITSETIRLNEAIYGIDLLMDYSKIDTIYIERQDLINFLMLTGIFDLEDDIEALTPVIAYDIDGVLADAQAEINLLVPDWDDLTYNVDVVFDDFNYLGLNVKDRPTGKIKYIITSRPQKYLEDTKVWLALHGIEYEYLIFSSNKLAVMQAFDIDVLIDDNPKTFQEVNEGGKVCFLYDCSYNRDMVTTLRIYNLSQVEELI